MKKIVLVLSLSLIAVTFVQCKKKKGAVASDEASKMEMPKKKNDKVIVESEYRWPGTTDAFELLAIKVEGDSLKVDVQYGGGCREHDFSLHTNLQYLKSLPPQLNLYLEHENHDDNCRALISKTLSFEISAIRHSGVRVVKVIVNDDREKMVEYAYPKQ
ncbi:MAG: hypothetical protein IT223_08155 [Crocinitomicaceae bacterium]|nr:hypothetical protein [Crocinitomicaceae bacterium]